jgi:tetratricopeptide (TPR) repeat protein
MARMKMRGTVRAGLLAGSMACVACGGSAPPRPQTPAAPASELDSPAATTTPPPAEAAPSPELLAGIKAFDAGNFADARASFQAAVKKNPNDYEALYNLGMACEKLNDRTAAEQAYKGALTAKPDLDTAAAALSALYVDANRTDDAIAVARAGLAKHPGSGALHENLGVALAARGDQDEALKEFQRALVVTPTEPMYHLTLAHWLNAWHLKGAVPHLDAARNLVKDDYGMVASVGYEYRMAGEFESCVQTFDHAVALKDGGEVRTERALCRLGLKDEKGTLEDLQAAVSKEPSYAPAHYYLGGRLALAKKFKEAAAEYSKYLSLAPDGSLARQAGERLKAAQEAAKGSKKR